MVLINHIKVLLPNKHYELVQKGYIFTYAIIHKEISTQSIESDPLTY